MKQLYKWGCMALLLLSTTTYAQSGISINGGYFGKLYDIGMETSIKIKKGQTINFGAAYRTYGKSVDQIWGNVAILTSSNIQTYKLSASFDFYLFSPQSDSSKKSSSSRKAAKRIKNSLKLRVGAQYVINPFYEFTSVSRDTVGWGTMKFSQEQIGSVVTTVSSTKFQPLIALGIDRLICYKNISVGGNIGVLYQGEPQVTMKATNMLEATASQASIIQANIKPYQLMPFGELVVKYSF